MKLATTLIVTAAMACMAVRGLAQGGFGGGGGGFGGGQGGLGGGQGGFGGGGFGGGQGGQGGQMGRMAPAVEDMNRRISRYLNGEEVRNILTPGEYSEWILDLKANQVVFAEARSDAFDPALEIVEGSKVLASNDDRYPGDQRPLLMWRCEHDGKYSLRVRCFHDKSGDAFEMRYNVYDSIDLTGGKMVEAKVPSGNPFLMRMSMKAGEIRQQIVGDKLGNASPQYMDLIAPNGLPDQVLLAYRMQPAIFAVMAAADGDYYLLERVYGPSDAEGKTSIQIQMAPMAPQMLNRTGDRAEGAGKPNTGTLFQVAVKPGDFLQVSASTLSTSCRIVVSEAPDLSNYDVAKPDSNPLYPHPAPNQDWAIEQLPKRDGDYRYFLFHAKRAAQVWIASNGVGGPAPEYKLTVGPGATPFPDASTSAGSLRIATTDYWAFEVKTGDVMTFKTEAKPFCQTVVLRDPDLSERWNVTAVLDQTRETWQLTFQKPGTYWLSVACKGGGGSGDYSLTRSVIHAKEFAIGKPAEGRIADGEVQVWRFTATPDKPLLIRWDTQQAGYSIEVTDERGSTMALPLSYIDPNVSYGILRVEHPTTYLIILTGRGHGEYKIRLEVIRSNGWLRLSRCDTLSHRFSFSFVRKRSCRQPAASGRRMRWSIAIHDLRRSR